MLPEVVTWKTRDANLTEGEALAMRRLAGLAG